MHQADMQRHALPWLAGAVLAAVFVLLSSDLHAEDSETPSKSKPAKAKSKSAKAKTKAAGKVAKAKHLDFKATYGQALLEARLRNLPVFVSRHKDF